ncbi:MAG TPA: cob(I)yrinic acid a,c-diamide adenosyltransferase [Candidatus Bathyarchaeia archaeon]|nr:cob(I)yrinic acid a,c-diamide adenosyltransferase [Candidatus Bathyarchaeia archaeon]
MTRAKAYTGTGDKGETGLYGGTRVQKDNPRVEAYGHVDELNSQIGLARAHLKDRDLDQMLRNIQENLFTIGGELASEKASSRIPKVSKEHLERLEKITDELDDKLEPLHRFILPAGSIASAQLHVARTICRRTERRIVALSRTEKLNPVIIPYLNRLSSLLFVMARTINKQDNVKDEEWIHK